MGGLMSRLGTTDQRYQIDDHPIEGDGESAADYSLCVNGLDNWCSIRPPLRSLPR